MFDNTLLIQGTRQEYESIIKLLKDIDVPPRQVLIEAKIYEVTLTGALANGVHGFFQKTASVELHLRPASLTAAMLAVRWIFPLARWSDKAANCWRFFARRK